MSSAARRTFTARAVEVQLALMLVECDNCGAPLDVKDSQRFAACSYCRVTSRVQSMKTMATQTPTDWKPPQAWTPPPHVSPKPLAYVPARSRPGGGIGGFAFAGKARRRAAEQMNPQGAPLLGVVDLGATPSTTLSRRGSTVGRIS